MANLSWLEEAIRKNREAQLKQREMVAIPLRKQYEQALKSYQSPVTPQTKALFELIEQKRRQNPVYVPFKPGTPTLSKQQLTEGTRQWEQEFAEGKRRWETELGESRKRWEAQQAQEKAWNRAQALGYVDKESSKILGIPEGTLLGGGQASKYEILTDEDLWKQALDLAKKYYDTSYTISKEPEDLIKTAEFYFNKLKEMRDRMTGAGTGQTELDLSEVEGYLNPDSPLLRDEKAREYINLDELFSK